MRSATFSTLSFFNCSLVGVNLETWSKVAAPIAITASDLLIARPSLLYGQPPPFCRDCHLTRWGTVSKCKLPRLRVCGAVTNFSRRSHHPR